MHFADFVLRSCRDNATMSIARHVCYGSFAKRIGDGHKSVSIAGSSMLLAELHAGREGYATTDKQALQRIVTCLLVFLEVSATATIDTVAMVEVQL